MAKIRPADVFPLCDLLKDELEARGWTAAKLAHQCYLSESRIQEILGGSRIFLREAEALAMAFGVQAVTLLTYQSEWLKRQA